MRERAGTALRLTWSRRNIFVVRPIVVCVVVIGALTMADRAEAFCLTTTTMPPGWNGSLSGCWDGGVPLHWPLSRVPYGVAAAGSPLLQITGAEATRAADLAFSSWKNAQCDADGGTPSIEGFDDGPITLVPQEPPLTNFDSCNPSAYNAIVFDDDNWPYPAGSTDGTIALTTVTYGVNDGRICEAYTEVNSRQNLALEPPAGSSAYDLQAVFTHEAGHFFGLAHPPDMTSIMWYRILPGDTLLKPDDVDGICTIYPPSGPSSRACSFTSARTHTHSSGIGAALVALCACCAARRGSRARRSASRVR